MPLVKGAAGKTKEGMNQNIKKEMGAGKPKKQAVAIAMNVAGKSKKAKKPALVVAIGVPKKSKKPSY